MSKTAAGREGDETAGLGRVMVANDTARGRQRVNVGMDGRAGRVASVAILFTGLAEFNIFY